MGLKTMIMMTIAKMTACENIVGRGSDKFVDLSEHSRSRQRAEQAADAAGEIDQKAIDDQRRAHVGKHSLEARHQDAGDAGEPRSIGESQRVHAVDVDTAGRRHLRIAHDGAEPHTDRRAVHEKPGQRRQLQRDDNDYGSIKVDFGASPGKCALYLFFGHEISFARRVSAHVERRSVAGANETNQPAQAAMSGARRSLLRRKNKKKPD